MTFKVSLITLMSGTVISQFVTIAMMPFLARYYSVAAFGDWALFVAITSILGVVASLRYDLSILLPIRYIDSLRLYKAAVVICTITSALTALIFLVLIMGKWLTAWLFFAAPLSMWLNGWMQTNIVLAYRNKDHRLIVRSRVAQSFATGAINLFFLIIPGLTLGAEELILATVLGQCIGSLAVTNTLKNCHKRKINFITRLNVPSKLLKSYIDFPIYSMPEALLGTMSSLMPLFIVGYLYTKDTVGQVALAWRVLMLPSALIGEAIASLLAQRFASRLASGGSIYNDMLKAWAITFIFGFGPALLLYLYGVQIFSFIFGSNWIESGYLASSLSIFVFGLFVFSVTSGAHVALRLQNASMSLAILSLALKLLIFLGYQYNLTKMLIGFLSVDLLLVIAMNAWALRIVRDRKF